MRSTFKNGRTSHIEHSERHIAVAKEIMPRRQRWAVGAALHNILHDLIAAKSGARSQGLAALRRGGTVRTMWVLKEPCGGYRKGHKVLSRSLQEHLSSLGGRFRTVHYPKDAATRDALSAMARRMSPLHHPAQYGFVPKRDCLQSAQEHRYARVVYLVDIENAFDQITYSEVVGILRRVFCLNEADACAIAELACVGNHLYQGCPIAPAIFNVRSLWMVSRLQSLCDSTGCTLTVYADDITISSDRWDHFSSGFRKTVLRIISECGLKVNARKCAVRAVSPLKIGHYDITGLTIDYDEHTGVPYVRPLHRRRVLKKADYIRELRARGVRFSNELAQDGTLKDLERVETGLRTWAEKEGRSGASAQLALPVAPRGSRCAGGSDSST